MNKVDTFIYNAFQHLRHMTKVTKDVKLGEVTKKLNICSEEQNQTDEGRLV